MIVYVGAGSGAFRDLVIAAGHGQMVSPQVGAFHNILHGRWAFDNGAYTDWTHGAPFDNERYLGRLEHISTLPDERLPDWCVVPDIVADPTSLSYSLRWRQALHKADRRLRWYLAIQDFMTPDDVLHALCLEPFDGLFIGGSTAWKWETAAKWVDWGHERGLPVHLARVNGPGPLQAAVDMGADSVDGTGWVRAGGKWYPHLKNVPAPSITLFAHDNPSIPDRWLKFGKYLENIWNERDWKRWAKEEHSALENADAIRAMSPTDFLAWLQQEYVSKAPSGPEDWRGKTAELYLDEAGKKVSFVNEEEMELWKRWILWEIERILVSPVPPAPELPRYGIIGGEALPLPIALKEIKGGVVEKCQDTGVEAIVVRSPTGEVLASYPVVRANSQEEALSS